MTAGSVSGEDGEEGGTHGGLGRACVNDVRVSEGHMFMRDGRYILPWSEEMALASAGRQGDRNIPEHTYEHDVSAQ